MDYFTQLREGHALVRTMKRLARVAQNAPAYLSGGGPFSVDEDGSDPEPNEAPHDDYAAADRKAWEHPVAASILRAWGHDQEAPLICYADVIQFTPEYGDKREEPHWW
jgi:hypothetical protein